MRSGLLSILFVSVLWGCSNVPKNIGVVNGQLQACPTSPNCVSSHETKASHQVKPFEFSGDPQQAWDKLVQVVRANERTTIEVLTSDYLHAVCTTKILRFKDDLEFLLDADNQVIHVRSASRLGRSDFGVNRGRVEALRVLWQE